MKPTQIALSSALVTVLAVAPAGIDAAVVAVFAIPLWYWSLENLSLRAALGGTVTALGGIIIAGLRGLEPSLLVFGAVGMVLGWSSTTHFVGLREQLDNTADIERSVLSHTGTTLAATAAIGAIVYAVFLVGLTVPPLALVLVFVGAVFVLLGLNWLR